MVREQLNNQYWIEIVHYMKTVWNRKLDNKKTIRTFKNNKTANY